MFTIDIYGQLNWNLCEWVMWKIGVSDRLVMIVRKMFFLSEIMARCS